MGELAKVGGGVVTRFEGSGDEMKVLLDELAADAGGDPLLLDLRSLVDKLDAFDQANEDFDLDYGFFMVMPRGTTAIISWSASLTAENEVPPVMNEVDPAAIVDPIQAHMDGSSVTELSRVVGLDPERTNAAAPAAESVYIMTFGNSGHGNSGEDGSADFFLVV